MKKTYLQKGFTLIELLVVIAIIGILSSVVLASLNTARNKGADAAVKSNLANARAQAEIVYDSRTANVNTYTNVCNTGAVDGVTGIGANVTAAGAASGTTAVCNSNASAWAAAAQLKATNVVGGTTGTDYWCVDSTGASKAIDSALGTATSC
jgi:type IV pilus assembly protein PilA